MLPQSTSPGRIRSPGRTSRSSPSCCSLCTLDLRAAGSIPCWFQATLIAMGVATFSLVFATLHYYRCSLGGGMSDTEKTLQARRADRFWLMGYTTMFLAPSLVLFLIGLHIVASVWLAFWLFYLFFVVRYFPRLQTPRAAK